MQIWTNQLDLEYVNSEWLVVSLYQKCLLDPFTILTLPIEFVCAQWIHTELLNILFLGLTIV